MGYDKDARTVMTLDAGGTNFVFSAMAGNKEVIEPITFPANGDQLDACLAGIVEGFSAVKQALPVSPVAISFAFPGPADYPAGIIGDLGNLPGFRGGVALGPMLAELFDVPVFINNDGDLFAYGEAMAGFLPWVNEQLDMAGSPKRFANLFGVTFGTGFGAGIVSHGKLFVGDNSGAGEIWLVRNKLDHDAFAEEGVSIRAVRRAYAAVADIPFDQAPQPKEIFEIGMGRTEGHRGAAIEAFRRLGEVAGDAIANAITLIDGVVVIGGGLAGAAELFLPSLVAEMNGIMSSISGVTIPRLEVTAFNLEDQTERQRFVAGERREVRVPASHNTVIYDGLRRVGVGISRLGTSRAVALGAYAFALDALDQRG
jgi:glucokinase